MLQMLLQLFTEQVLVQLHGLLCLPAARASIEELVGWTRGHPERCSKTQSAYYQSQPSIMCHVSAYKRLLQGTYAFKGDSPPTI